MIRTEIKLANDDYKDIQDQILEQYFADAAEATYVMEVFGYKSKIDELKAFV